MGTGASWDERGAIIERELEGVKEVEEVEEVEEVQAWRRREVMIRRCKGMPEPPPPCFSEVRILKELREGFFVSADSKGVISLVFSPVTRGARKC
jgi:hypothetical protein